ncbi:phage recombination protein Bet [Carnobacterium maltaromaticum]|uniref:Phage recombination protein Bet n=1 Tax=Carnobacterium maltaromaticum LMA28 TaxID=1234679 RepID=K8EIC8_CARML|nr:phage recombination protein Bet [Carnobacterium maltaromaticum]CCO11603.2 phage recombination protein Bet [Carnobacterium maltaromaticum LMA28]
MANELMDKQVVYEVNGEEVKLSGNMIRNYLVSGDEPVSDQEVVLFLNLCKFQKLNPFLKEAFLVKFKGRPAQIIVSKEAFMKRAEANPQYNGFEAGIIVERNNELIDLPGAIMLTGDAIKGGWAKVFRKDREYPILVKISFKEFSKGQSTWNQMPLTMIRKTALVNALREAFPDNLGAMYTEEEQQVPTELPQEVIVQQEIEENSNQIEVDIEVEPEVNPRKDVSEVEQSQLFDEVNPPIEPAF